MVTIITKSGVKFRTDNINTIKTYIEEGAIVSDNDSIAVYPIWLNKDEKDQIIAHWEKTGMFGSLIPKIRSSENTKLVN